MATISCPHCQQHFDVELQSEPQDLQCSVCEGEFEVPAAAPAQVVPKRPTLITQAPASAPVGNPVASSNQPVNPYAAPVSGALAPHVAVPVFHTGIGRGMFVVLLFAVMVLPIAFAAFAARGGMAGILLLIGVTILLWMYPFAKRLENMGYHWAFCFLMLVPIVSFFVVLACLVLPKGFAQNMRIDAPGIVMLVLVVGLIGWAVAVG